MGKNREVQLSGFFVGSSKKGWPLNIESFFATLKKGQIYRTKYDTIESVKKNMFGYIELFYNRKRMHSVLGYLSPVEYRLKYDDTSVA